MLTRRALGQLALPLPLALAAPGAAKAQAEWPDRPVRVVVPFGPGGAIDILIRLMAPHFPALAHGQALLVENRPGAGGTIGANVTAQARPDGHTLLMAEQGSGLLAHELYRGLPYDPRSAFTPICFLAALPMVLLVRADMPARSVAEFLALARSKPGGMTYGSVGTGHISHLTAELLASRAQARMLHVTYRSGAEVVTAIARGDIDFTINSLSSAAPSLQSGQGRALAVTTAERLPGMPEVPTIEATLPGVAATLWYGLVGPAGMPAPLVARINAVCNAVLAVPEFKAALLQQQGTTPIGGPPERLAQHFASEMARWVPVLHAAGVKAE